MAAVHIFSTSNIDFSVTTVAITRTVANAASAMFVGCGWLNTTSTLTSVVNTGANTGSHTLLQNPTTATTKGRAAQGYKLNCTTGSTTITMTLSAAVTLEMVYHEATGLDTSSAEDPTGGVTGNVQTTGTSRTNTGLTSTSNGSYLFAHCWSFDLTAPPTAVSAPFTSGNLGSIMRSGYYIQPTAGAQTVTFTGVGNADVTATMIMGLKVPGGAPAAPVGKLVNPKQAVNRASTY